MATLGLAISARLVQLMDGKIWLESQPGQGAVFTFTGRFGVEVAAQELPAQARYAGRRALVIDDNLSCARYLVELLDRLGIQASLSTDGAAAVEAIERSRAVDFPYDYIVADANMDAPSGFALAEAQRCCSVAAPAEKKLLETSGEVHGSGNGNAANQAGDIFCAGHPATLG